MTKSFSWNELDERAVAFGKALAADAVEKVGSGHPGAAISLTAAAYLLYQKEMRVDPACPTWLGRDRFILSAGHASVMQYVQLVLAGYGLEVSDLEQLRRRGSRTPAHPEYGHTPGVEATTGPLGSGFAAAVGMAAAARREHGLYDAATPAGESIFDHNIYVIAGDGCMQEGVTIEAASFAGTQELGNLIVIWDDNAITIEGDAALAFRDDVEARFAAQGWHTAHVDWRNAGSDGGYYEDVKALHEALEAARAETKRPSLIRLSTIIAWPCPTKQGSASSHGAKLGESEVAGLKQNLGLDPNERFALPEQVLEHTRTQAGQRGAELHAAWEKRFEAWGQANPQALELLERVRAGLLPAELDDVLPVFEPGSSLSTRAASGKTLSAIASTLPELWGGSADLGGSNMTNIAGASEFLPEGSLNPEENGPYGRIIHFGVREHAMGNMLNGIVQSGLTRAYGGTFLVFSDYMRPAVRLAALQKLPTVFVWSHDSIGVGEDGPTHQPIEHIASLRVIPGLSVVRPADANEAAQAWLGALAHRDSPTGLVLSRQNLPIFDRSQGGFAPAEGTLRGAYTLVEASNSKPQVLLLATGSEVALAVEARQALEAEGIPTRVVSVPCWEWFHAQDAEYRESVLPSQVKARVAMEAASSMGWREWVGDAGEIIAIDEYGESATPAELFEYFGFTVDNVVAKAKQSLARA